jgi:hypothetical protein
VLSECPQIVFKRTSIWAIDGYPAISLCDELIISDGGPL